MTSRKRSTPKRRKAKYVYQLLVTLAESAPRIWRQISVPGNLTLSDLDRVIQLAMGWTNSHLHQFVVEGVRYGLPDDEWQDEQPLLSDAEITIDDAIGDRVKDFLYEYDFGDGWEHQVTVQLLMLPAEERNSWPMCLGGANACPPEDVGGISGYDEFVMAIRSPGHDEHDAMWRWWGGPFDPESFDINSANRAIRMWLITGQ